jgi:hypothetical protein
MTKNYKEYDIKRPGFTDGIKVRIYKTPESMRRGYLAEWALSHLPKVIKKGFPEKDRVMIG